MPQPSDTAEQVPLMAREYARIKTSISTDVEFAALPYQAQYLYTTVLLVHGSLSSCGVVDWRPKRLTTRAANLDLATVMGAAGHLEESRYVLFDPDTEEALVRTFIRNDDLLRNPKMALSVVRSYAACASPTLRAAVISELKKAREENPSYSSWTSPLSQESLTELLTQPDLDSVGYTNRITNRITNTDLGADYQSDWEADSNHNPHTATRNLKTSNNGGLVSGVPHQSATPDAPFHCSQHPDGNPMRIPCGECGDVRKSNKRMEDDEVARKRRANADALQRRHDCPHCDHNGLIMLADDIQTRCTLHDEAVS